MSGHVNFFAEPLTIGGSKTPNLQGESGDGHDHKDAFLEVLNEADAPDDGAQAEVLPIAASPTASPTTGVLSSDAPIETTSDTTPSFETPSHFLVAPQSDTKITPPQPGNALHSTQAQLPAEPPFRQSAAAVLTNETPAVSSIGFSTNSSDTIAPSTDGAISPRTVVDTALRATVAEAEVTQQTDVATEIKPTNIEIEVQPISATETKLGPAVYAQSDIETVPTAEINTKLAASETAVKPATIIETDAAPVTRSEAEIKSTTVETVIKPVTATDREAPRDIVAATKTVRTDAPIELEKSATVSAEPRNTNSLPAPQSEFAEQRSIPQPSANTPLQPGTEAELAKALPSSAANTPTAEFETGAAPTAPRSAPTDLTTGPATRETTVRIDAPLRPEKSVAPVQQPSTPLTSTEHPLALPQPGIVPVETPFPQSAVAAQTSNATEVSPEATKIQASPTAATHNTLLDAAVSAAPQGEQPAKQLPNQSEIQPEQAVHEKPSQADAISDPELQRQPVAATTNNLAEPVSLTGLSNANTSTELAGIASDNPLAPSQPGPALRPSHVHIPAVTPAPQSAAAVLTAQVSDIPNILSEALSAEDGTQQIKVQLDPPELGRVSIDFKFEGNVLQNILVTGETAEAMRRLRLMHFELIQTLEDFGYSGQDLDFSQRDQQKQDFREHDTFNPEVSTASFSDTEFTQAIPSARSTRIARSEGLDLKL